MTKLDAVKGVGASQPKGRAPGRGSILWDTFTDLANLPLLLPVATMQSALPAVGTAVNKYGIYKSDPQARGRRTNWSMLRFLWDGGDLAQREAADLRALHANIKGTLDDGSKYFALNPKTFRIVPDTFLDAAIRIHEDLGKPLSETDKEKLYQEYVQLCLLLGIPEKDIEPTLKDFYVYFEDLILNTMTYNETVQYLTTKGIEMPARLKRLKALQPWVDAFHRRYVYPTLKLCAIGCLHPLYRKRFNLPWSEQDQASYAKLCRRLSAFAKRVPRALRYNPVAYLVMLGIHGPGLVTLEELNKIELKKKQRAEQRKLAVGE
ncbi:MAG TPA: oxygenase MpaB family protein [Pseudomonadales bacterium]|nr:oxygenase MpaB family protein [Pseudomonadales bacterium]